MDDYKKYEVALHGCQNFYASIKSVYCPFFGHNITFNADGLHHLRFSGGRERSKGEQLLKFSLLQEYVLNVLEYSGTVQEYRQVPIQLSKGRHTKKITYSTSYTYWAFVAIVGVNRKERVKIIVRQHKNGIPHFWSIMKAERHKGDSVYLYR
ncbi:hypothetical protein BH11PAT2_BH11PAT2_08490 [soil metagenome]